TDRVCYLRPSSFLAAETGGAALGGPQLQSCHERLRATAAQLERGFAEVGAAKSFLLTDWTQLVARWRPGGDVLRRAEAHYTEGSGFYKWHRDGLESDWSGLLGWYYWLQRGAVRRRSVTGILYLNEEDWLPTSGGALRCRAAVAGVDVEKKSGLAEILPKGGRLVLFDSRKVEHEVVSTLRDRWALTAWFHE
ncbi:unnamed protein product, partial [Durusdinium trenchii]